MHFIFAAFAACLLSVHRVESALMKSPKIIGGTMAKIEDIPWQAMILYKNRLICGGSILDVNRILTAAHCVNGRDEKLFSVTVGTGNTINGGRKIEVARLVVHESYDKPKNDIAIIVLKDTLKFNNKTQPAKLPNDNSDLKEGTKVIISGLGVTEHEPAPLILQAATVEIIDREKCKTAIANYERGKWTVDSSMLCAGILVQGGIDVCLGDSGGPLTTEQDKILHGVISWGVGCAIPGVPAVYVKVAAYIDWIREQI